MKAIVLKDFGGVDQLQETELPTPGISDGEVLVEVKAISINPVDIKTREGKGLAEMLKGSAPMILGWDISGVVTDSKSPLFQEGDEVFGMINFPGVGRAYAQHVAAPADQLALKPQDVSHPAAAAAGLAALTAWQAFADHSRLKSGQRVLVHAASGGVGHFAVQIAKHIGAYVIGTSSAENRDFVLGLGADEHIDYRTQDVGAVVKNVDLVLDPLGGANIDLSLKTLKKGGTLVSLVAEPADKLEEKAAAAGVTGKKMYVQSSGEDMEGIAQLLAEGDLKPVIPILFPWEKIADAHELVESGKARGKVVVAV